MSDPRHDAAVDQPSKVVPNGDVAARWEPVLLAVPELRQRFSWDCGLTCIAMVLQYAVVLWLL